MKRLVFHIGTHKTGTTTIQEALEHNRPRLAARSICYARTDRAPHASLPKHSSLAHALLRGGDAATAELDLLLSEFEKSKCRTLVLSAEGLSELGDKALAPLRDLSADFEIRIVCLLRRPDYFVEALWNQFCREGREKRDILAFSRARPIVARTRYATLLDRWSGIGTVRAASFDAARKQGLLNLFGGLAGIDIPTDIQPHGNPTPSMNCAAALALLNSAGTDYDIGQIVAAFGADRCKRALGARRRAKLLAQSDDELARLAHDYGVTFDTDMPEEPDKPLLQPDVASLLSALAVLSHASAPGSPLERLPSLLKARSLRRN